MRSNVASGSDREAEAGDILEPSAAFGSLVAGEVVLDGDRRAIFRGADGKLRGRGIEPRAVRGDGHHPVTLALGERLTLGDWEVRWTGVHEGLVQLEGRHRQQPAGRVGASTDARLAIHELRSHHQLFTFEVELVGTRGRLDGADGRIDVLGRPTDVAPAVAFGQTLKPGVYAFPDGFRLRVEQMTACDFDVSDPCTFGGHYRAYAALGEREDHVEIKNSRTPLLGHILEFRLRAFVVRK